MMNEQKRKLRPSDDAGSQSAPIRQALRMLTAVAMLAGYGLLAACGGGATTELNPNVGTSGPAGYTGPAAQNESVRNFQLEIWPQLKTNCGNCHSPDTTANQEPYFARNDDVNQAYNAAITVANLNDPAASRLVIRVGNGHNCWQPTDSQCASDMTTWITNWANGGSGGGGGGGGGLVLSAPTYREPGGSRAFPASATAPSPSFAETVYPILRANCSGCHSEEAPAATRNSPFFASPNVDTAYAEVKPKIDLGDGDIPMSTPITDKVANSRLVVRLRDEFHNCWTASCDDDALEMRNAIIRFASAISASGLDPADLTVSGALTLGEGLLATSGARYEANVIAKWEFREGAGDIVADVSGVGDPAPLRIFGLGSTVDWVGGNGLEFRGGLAQATSDASNKIYDRIAGPSGTGEYSLEAWVIPANVTQEDRFIAGYTQGNDDHNIMLGQTMYNYDFVNWSSASGRTNDSALSTPDAAEVLQATLQHVVVNFSPTTGREIYVNGQLVASDNAPGTLNWGADYVFSLGNIPGGNNATGWFGRIRMLAIHERVLTPEQITTNFDGGVGEKRFLLFDVGNQDGVPENSYVMLEVSQIDDYAYVFNKPVFVNLDAAWTPTTAIPIRGLRLGINGHLAPLGQAYAYLNTQVDSASYVAGVGQVLSDIGTIIPVENGPDSDEFFLAFEVIGNGGTAYVENDPPAPLRAEPDPVPAIGLRTFEEINQTMSDLTGVPTTNAAIGGASGTYTTYKQQFPSVENIEAFLSSHQMAISQLAMTYCDELVNNRGTIDRATYFPGLDFAAALPADRSVVIDPLLERMMNVVPGDAARSVTSQPAEADLRLELNNLMDALCANSACTTGTRTEQVVTAACAVALGSATMLIQ